MKERAACHQSLKFELRMGHEGRAYKIWNFMYKIVQNGNKIMIQFFILKLHFGGLHFTSPPPKFELRIAQEGTVYKIFKFMYKIVQNEYKIMIKFFTLKLHLGCCMSQPPKFELPIAQEGMVYKIWYSVYKIVQNKCKNYDILFVLEIRFGGAGDMYLQNVFVHKIVKFILVLKQFCKLSYI